MNKDIKIFVMLLMIIGISGSVALAADSKAGVEDYLHEKLTREEFDIMKRIKAVSDMPYSDIFTGYIEPMREGLTPNELDQRDKPVSVPESKAPVVAKNTDSEKPISVKGADAKKRAQELSLESGSDYSEEDTMGEVSVTDSKPKSKSMREKLDEAKYEEQNKKRKKLDDRFENGDRTMDKRRGLVDFNRTKKKQKFGGKRLDVGKDGLPVEDVAEGYHLDGFKKKPFGAKKNKATANSDSDAKGFDVFSNKKKTTTGFNKKLKRKGEYRRPERKKFNVRDRDE